MSGTLAIAGLSAPVRVVRDKWGVPHLYAESQPDLFFAQGFVQAQDRLFQMDLWRRSAQGRLSEVLGANFIERDAMTRRMQYQGDLRAEWNSYGADTEAIATAFVRGINAWIDAVGERLPEEFALAGWRPEHWKPTDLLNRTDAFLSSANAADEVLNARLLTALGAAQADALQVASPLRLLPPRGLDMAAVTYVVGDALRGVGAAPFFSGLRAPVRDPRTGSNAWAVSGARSATGAPILAADPHRFLDHPSFRYLIHLAAPGWNVIGAATPWLPGVVIGHNDQIAWAMTSLAADVQDLYAEKVNPANPHQVERAGRWVETKVLADPILVKGREKPFPFERESTSHGVVIASDRARQLAFTVRWTGFEPGTAAELGALAIDRATSAADLQAALVRWKLPAATFVYAARDGGIGTEAAGLVPVRRSWNGALPAPGWSGQYEWDRWAIADRRLAAGDGRDHVADANDSVARTRRIEEALGAQPSFSVDDVKRLQHDTLAWNAAQLLPLLARVKAERDEVEEARGRLLQWEDRSLAAGSSDAALYVLWERALLRRLVRGKLPSPLVEDVVARGQAIVVPAVTRPSSAWFSGNVTRARDELMLAALGDAVDAARAGTSGGALGWGKLHTALFRHPLAVTPQARSTFNIGPFERGGYQDAVMSTGGAGLEQTDGATLRLIVDVANWDRSVATNAPGQSQWPASPHFADLAKLWAAGEYFPLPFSDRAVQENTETTLTLAPLR